MFNPFKKKTKPVAAKPVEPKREEVVVSGPAAAKAPAKGERRITGVIIAPHLTEKTSRAAAGGWYTFRVSPESNKLEIKAAVEDRYGVSVERVRALRQRPKRVRLGRITGTRPGFTKAMVKVKGGQTIEFA